MSEELYLDEFIKKHSEITYIRIMWKWNYYATYIDNGLLWAESGKTIDYEYSYFGFPDENFFKYLEDYEVWKGVARKEEEWCKHIRHTVFVFEQDAENPIEDYEIQDEKPNYSAPESLYDVVEMHRTPLMIATADTSGKNNCFFCEHMKGTGSGYAAHCTCHSSPIAYNTLRTCEGSLVPCKFFSLNPEFKEEE